MGFLADRAVGHGPGFEPLGDGLNRLHLVKRNRFRGVFEAEQAAQGGQPFGLIVNQARVLFEGGVIVRATGFLQQMNRARVEQMQLAVFAVLVLAVDLQGAAVDRDVGKGFGVLAFSFFGNGVETDPAHPGRGPGKVGIDQLLAQADGFKDLRPAVGLDGRNAHL